LDEPLHSRKCLPSASAGLDQSDADPPLDVIGRCPCQLYGVYIHKTMILTIQTDDTRPIYQQVVDGIKELIARGELAEGTPLPPVRQLAADLGVNLNTIAVAYRELQKDGLIVVKHGSGSVVALRTPTERTQGELRTPLRIALTQFVLAGWTKKTILELVAKELDIVGRGSK
jgi:GntR family transcriptional regulator